MASRAWLPCATRPSSHRTRRRRRRRRSIPIGPRALEQPDPAAEELVLEGGGDLGVLLREDLLAGDDQGHLAPERREHVHELDAGDAGADHDEVLGQSGGG